MTEKYRWELKHAYIMFVMHSYMVIDVWIIYLWLTFFNGYVITFFLFIFYFLVKSRKECIEGSSKVNLPIKISAQLTSPLVFLKICTENPTVKIVKNILF